jgi:phosphatidylglycerol---prolipoprotein diacylglyceryl transferase
MAVELMPTLSGLLSLPSPTSPVVFEVGPFTLRYFGLLIVLGMVGGTCLRGRELDRKGYDGALAIESLFFVVILGVVARLHHVATEYDSQYAASSFSSVLKI